LPVAFARRAKARPPLLFLSFACALKANKHKLKNKNKKAPFA
jgi:hypothetical protein